ncbi:hypothetical protein P9139_21540 [Curtobacterium flaccumfaciens]|nr:hypothetical protein P9139_21540 [Curtobacterium flaccumfaciens]
MLISPFSPETVSETPFWTLTLPSSAGFHDVVWMSVAFVDHGSRNWVTNFFFVASSYFAVAAMLFEASSPAPSSDA